MKKIALVAPVFAILMSFCGVRANASGLDVAALAGVGILNNNGGSPFAYGVEVDYQLEPSWSIGLEFTTLNPNSTTIGGSSYSLGVTNLDFSIKYLVGSFNIGGLVGYNAYSTNVPAGTSGSYLNYGATAGYDIAVCPSFSVGPQVDVLWTSQSAGYQETNVLAAFKYLF
jgi:hypothetical protein